MKQTRWFVRGDIDGFFGLFIDNLLQIIMGGTKETETDGLRNWTSATNQMLSKATDSRCGTAAPGCAFPSDTAEGNCATIFKNCSLNYRFLSK